MKFVKWALVALYIFFILTQTIIGRSIQAEPIFRGLFWEVQSGMWLDIWFNILLFIPLGFLIGGWRGLIFGLILSCGVETVQYVLRLGFCELDDVLNNTIGSGIGAAIHVIVKKIITSFESKG